MAVPMPQLYGLNWLYIIAVSDEINILIVFGCTVVVFAVTIQFYTKHIVVYCHHDAVIIDQITRAADDL